MGVFQYHTHTSRWDKFPTSCISNSRNAYRIQLSLWEMIMYPINAQEGTAPWFRRSEWVNNVHVSKSILWVYTPVPGGERPSSIVALWVVYNTLEVSIHTTTDKDKYCLCLSQEGLHCTQVRDVSLNMGGTLESLNLPTNPLTYLPHTNPHSTLGYSFSV